MSSHHIVREKQEPALLIAGLNNFPEELLGQLLEWSPTVVVTADTAEKVRSLGIKIDWLVADSATDLEQLSIEHINPNGGDPVTAALDTLAAKGYHAVNLITDVLATDRYAAFFARLDLVIFCGEKKIIAVHTGFSKWKPAGDRIEILTLPHHFLYTGLQPIANNVYQTPRDGFFTLQFSDAYVLIAEQL